MKKRAKTRAEKRLQKETKWFTVASTYLNHVCRAIARNTRPQTNKAQREELHSHSASPAANLTLLSLFLLSLFTHTASALTLSWQPLSRASHYQVQMRTLPSGIWQNINTQQPQTGTEINLDFLTPAQYEFRVGGCIEQTGVAVYCGEQYARYSDPLNVDLINPFNPDQDFIVDVPAIAAMNVPAQSASSAAVTRVPHQFNVTPQGGAAYSVPINVPTGVGGVRPQVSVSYSSLAGNELLGVGWQLSASSSIRRCQQTLEDDGVFRQIAFTQTDALCLGSTKLRLASGSHFTAGATYQPDNDPYTLIEQKNSGASTYFVMKKSNGESRIFGQSAHARAADIASNQPYLWRLEQVENRFGKTIDYQYHRVANEQAVPTSITWSGNTIDFVYETRPDASTHFYLGNKTIKNKRLARIDITNHTSELVRSYHFNYRLSAFSDRSLLTGIRLCADTTQTLCAQPHEFTYSDTDAVGLGSTFTSINIDTFEDVDGDSNCRENFTNGFCRIYAMKVSDLNRDGKPELIVSSRKGETGKILAFEYDNGTFTLNRELSVFNESMIRIAPTNAPVSYTFNWQISDDNTTGNRYIGSDGLSYDWDGDGYDEAGPNFNNNINAIINHYSYQESDSANFEVTAFRDSRQNQPFDFNGDGLMDRFIPLLLEVELIAGNQDGSISTVTERIDDYHLLEINTSTVDPNTGESIYSGELLNLPEPIGTCSTYAQCTPEIALKDLPGVFTTLPFANADFNGDGIPDSTSGSVYTGIELNKEALNYNLQSSVERRLGSYKDLNGDGKDDQVYAIDGDIYWKQAQQESFANAELLVNNAFSEINKVYPFIWADLDGDDQPELIYFDIGAQRIDILFDSNTDQTIQDKLTQADAGLSNTLELRYLPLFDTRVYQKFNDAPSINSTGNWGEGAKVRDIISNMPVVRSAIQAKALSESGDVQYEQTDYLYRGMKSQAGGRGALGFAEVESTQHSTGMITTQYFRQDHPFESRLYKREVRHNSDADNNLISQMEITDWWQLAFTGIAGNADAGTYVAPKTTTTTQYYANVPTGATSNQITTTTLAASTTQSTTYALTGSTYSYPQMSREVLSTTDHFDNKISTRTTTYHYTAEDETNWWINRFTKQTQTFTRTGESNVTQTVAREFDSANEAGHGALVANIREPDSTDLSLYLQTRYHFDSHGNRITTTQCSVNFKDQCALTATPETSAHPQHIFRRIYNDYDSEGRYLTALRNPVFTEQSFHSFNKFGVPEEIRINQYDTSAGQREFQRFDSLGNLRYRYQNTGAAQTITQSVCSQRTGHSDTACPANAVYAVETHDTAAPDTVQFFDISGNPVQQSTQLVDGSWTHIAMSFDVNGREIAVSQPFKTGGTQYQDRITYDDIGRKTLVTKDGSALTGNNALTTSFSYNTGQTTQAITGTYNDEVSINIDLARTREEHFNGRGDLLETEDTLGNSVLFTYNAVGVMRQATNVDNTVIQQQSDAWGRITGLIDPSKGTETYTFNALDERVIFTYADTSTRSTYRNNIGQVEREQYQRNSTVRNVYFDYQNTPFLQEERNGATGTETARTEYVYDDYHRLSQKSITLDEHNWLSQTWYDSVGRVFREHDISGNGRGLQYQYANGTLNRLFETQTGNAYFRATAADQFGNITSATFGTGINVTKGFDPSTSYLRSLYANVAGANQAIQDQHYRYDQLGNTRYRSDNSVRSGSGVVETFTYDVLNRLKTTAQQHALSNTVLNQRFNYTANGNIASKSNVANGATYTYGTQAALCTQSSSVAAPSHAVSTIGSRYQYCYDSRGNQTHAFDTQVTENGGEIRSITYNLFNKPSSITSADGTSEFFYDANNALYKRIDDTRRGRITTYLVNGHEYLEYESGEQMGISETKRYIQDFAIHSIKNTGDDTLHYLFTDHIGSGTVITDKNGNVEHRVSFDAFGQRREGEQWLNVNTPYHSVSELDALLDITQKGFTGHQQVDHANIIHMGGRIYDPLTGRFMQADPIVQAPEDSQSLNRYSYVLNNPLSYTDPTGYECNSRVGAPILNKTAAGCQNGANNNETHTNADGSTDTSGESDDSDVNSANLSDSLSNSARRAAGETQEEDDTCTQNCTWGQVLSQSWKQIVSDAVGGVANQSQLDAAVLEFTGAQDITNGAINMAEGDIVKGGLKVAGGAILGKIKPLKKAADKLAGGKAGDSNALVPKSGGKSIKDQAADLVPANANKNRVTLRSNKQQLEIDLAGKDHAGIPTPHTKVSPRNTRAPEHLQPAYNTSEKKSVLRPSTQQDIRTARRYLERQNR